MLGGSLSLTIHIVGAMMSGECMHIFHEKLKHYTNIYEDTFVYRRLYIPNDILNIILQTRMAIIICSLIIEVSIVLSTLIKFFNGTYEEFNGLMTASFVTLCAIGLLCMLALLGGLLSVFKESTEVLSIFPKVDRNR